MSTPTVIAIVQARVSSTRLPRKVLLDVGGKTMLEQVIGRLRSCSTVGEVVVATSDAVDDDELAEFCGSRDIPFVRGPLHDVLGRFVAAVDAFPADIVVRVTSDCPLADPTLVDEVVSRLIESGADYAANRLVDKRAYPIGLDAEAFTVSALRKANDEATEPYQREHVTPYLYVGDHGFHVEYVGRPHPSANQRWTVDTPDDLEFARQVFQRLAGSTSWRDVLSIVEREPELLSLNEHVAQKSVYDAQKEENA